MSEALQGLFSDAKKGKYSSIRDTLSEDDVASIWENVCGFIAKQMTQQKGVNIGGLGTFTFSQQKLDIGNKKFLLMQRPVFNIAEKFAQTHALHTSKRYAPGQIPVVPLNYAAVSFESPFDRDTVEGCVREILNAITRALGARRNVELLFPGVGRLSIREMKVKMKFFKEFINELDGSGRLMDSLQNRPGTVDSVMSDRTISRCGSSTLVLPKITSHNQSEQVKCLSPVCEEGVNPLDQGKDPGDMSARQLAEALAEKYACRSERVPVCEDSSEGHYVPACDEPMSQEMEEGMEGPEVGDIMTATALENILKEGEPMHNLHEYIPEPQFSHLEEPKKSVTIISRACSRQTMQLPCASGINIYEELNPEAPGFQTSPPCQTPQPCRIPHPVTAPSCRPPPGHLTPIERPATAESSCGHPNAGQELCYLCHQRARRNIPVSFAEERRRREEEEEKLLHQFHVMKDAEDTIMEHEKQIGKRHELQKLAAFNSGVAEATNSKKKAKDNCFHRSYIFQRRPLTPPRFPKQEEYNKELTKQVQANEGVKQKEKAETEFLEKLEQVQLAEDIAALREKQIRDKAEQMEMVKRGLETQLKFKPLPIPACEADGEIFGKNDLTNEKMLEKRRKAYELFQSQQELVAQKKRETILKKLCEQKEEEEILERTKRELLDDRAHRFKTRMNTRKHLEDNWCRTVHMKRARDAEEHLASLCPEGLVHEQCDKYRRCRQCQRKLGNKGVTNIWCETRYIPGSRLMV
ncbi:coiled-coil domain-containing protein 81-like isoform X2 [Gigantopelta aegis]|uniref:coiled-coil domain-containing protein 81-like isoform X2 n=1 Tax=Gigantopelta aegis TaxID=1735272 RepID=UPI001B88B3F9|nr:coiled-coil domain-containing protein 81-like isoform X2 [Gigantopelta aegis]